MAVVVACLSHDDDDVRDDYKMNARHRPKPPSKDPRAVAERIMKTHNNNNNNNKRSSTVEWWKNERNLPRLNTALVAFTWLYLLFGVLFTYGTSGGVGKGIGDTTTENVRHEMQHLKSRLTSQAHHQLTFNVHPTANGDTLRHPPHEKDFITGMDLMALQDYSLCCSWNGNFICDEQRVRAVVKSSSSNGSAGGPYLEIISFIGKTDAHCVFSWTEMSNPRN